MSEAVRKLEPTLRGTPGVVDGGATGRVMMRLRRAGGLDDAEIGVQKFSQATSERKRSARAQVHGVGQGDDGGASERLRVVFSKPHEEGHGQQRDDAEDHLLRCKTPP